jgi:hypothetical protein
VTHPYPYPPQDPGTIVATGTKIAGRACLIPFGENQQGVKIGSIFSVTNDFGLILGYFGVPLPKSKILCRILHPHLYVNDYLWVKQCHLHHPQIHHFHRW